MSSINCISSFWSEQSEELRIAVVTSLVIAVAAAVTFPLLFHYGVLSRDIALIAGGSALAPLMIFLILGSCCGEKKRVSLPNPTVGLHERRLMDGIERDPNFVYSRRDLATST